jgi:hypothetical protein
LGKTVEYFFPKRISKENFLFSRLQISFGVFKQYMLCVKSMLASTDELIVRAATIIKSKQRF